MFSCKLALHQTLVVAFGQNAPHQSLEGVALVDRVTGFSHGIDVGLGLCGLGVSLEEILRYFIELFVIFMQISMMKLCGNF